MTYANKSLIENKMCVHDTPGAVKGSIVLYGIKHLELQKNIEFFLDDSFEVTAYSDSYYMGDKWRGKPFIKPAELQYYDFDYILLLAYADKTFQNMKEFLCQLGIPDEKILTPTMFLFHDAASNQVDLIDEIETTYCGETGLIFGMSYSMGMGKQMLKIPFYNCSWSAMDLYYNFRIFEYMKERGFLSEVKIALLVFPHYYFTYDLSQCRNTYKTGEMFAIRRLNDWHHGDWVPGGQDYIKNFCLFGEKITQFYQPLRHENKSIRIYQGENSAAQLTKMWFRNYEKTVEENKKIFRQFIQEMLSARITPVLVIPPVYLNGIDRESEIVFYEKKNQFYQIIEETQQWTGKLNVFDYADAFFNERNLFEDLVHMNLTGLTRFSERINQDILKDQSYLSLN